ncbi:MAG: diguanylate cyclase [Ramlibacter sp.]|jgi:diguanylate cyclase (GGDEF)-like protein|nr:diguanylate cyclase [Ramlibacter sp.]
MSRKSSREPIGRPSSVSFRLRSLEYLLPWALAACTAWTAIFMFPTALTAWGMAFVALVLGAWSRAFPARAPSVMMLRAVLLLVGASALHLSPETAGAAGPFYFWPVTIACGFALLLERPWALGLFALCITEYALALWLLPPVNAWRDALASSILLIAFPAIALVFARSVQRSDAQVEASLTDVQTGLYNAAGLFAHGQELFHACRREKRPLSLALLQFRDMKDVSLILGRTAARTVFVNTVGALARATQGRSIAARTGREEFALLLPGMNQEQAKSLLEDRLGRPLRVVIEVRKRKVTIMLDSAILPARDRSPTLEALYDQVRHRLMRKRAQLNDPQPAAQDSPSAAVPLLEDTDSAPLSRLEINPTLPMSLDQLLSHGDPGAPKPRS